MTKGHFHSVRDTGEVYLGLSGHGYLLLMTEEGGRSASPMGPGTVAYVPPYWAHRTVNTGDEPFVFFAVYPGQAGHDYGTIEQSGFAQRVLRTPEGPVLRDRDGAVARSPPYALCPSAWWWSRPVRSGCTTRACAGAWRPRWGRSATVPARWPRPNWSRRSVMPTACWPAWTT